MPIVCNLLQIPSHRAEALAIAPSTLQDEINSATIYSDVYRYWDGIRYLLSKHFSKHCPDAIAARWTTCGQEVGIASDIPAARILVAAEVAQLAAAIETIEPDDLASYYDAADFDEAGVYPSCWQEWEETFDPLGQVLEHYWFLKQFVEEAHQDGAGIILEFAMLDDGSDF